MNGIQIGWKPAVCIVILLSVCFVCGCTDDSPAGGDATPAPTATPTAESAPQAFAPGDVVHYSTLMEYLPTMTSNWITGEKDGATMSYSGESWSQAYGDYTLKSDESVVGYVAIQDTRGIKGVGYSEMWQAKMTFETPEMKMYTGTAGGYPAHVMSGGRWCRYGFRMLCRAGLVLRSGYGADSFQYRRYRSLYARGKRRGVSQGSLHSG